MGKHGPPTKPVLPLLGFEGYPEYKNIVNYIDVIRGKGTLKYGDLHEKFHFSEIQGLRPLSTCQKHFETILPNFLLDTCEI